VIFEAAASMCYWLQYQFHQGKANTKNPMGRGYEPPEIMQANEDGSMEKERILSGKMAFATSPTPVSLIFGNTM
jgi:hypothetical protein